MGGSDKPERGLARVVATIVVVTTVLIAGAAARHVAEDAARRQQEQIWNTPNHGYPSEPTVIADPAAEREQLVEARERQRKELAYEEYLREASACGAVREGEPLNLAVVCEPPLSREAWEEATEHYALLNAQRRAAREKRRASLNKKKRETDRAYEEYLAGFPHCETYVEGAVLNDLCGPRPLSRKEWERRGKVGEQADPSAPDPLRGLERY